MVSVLHKELEYKVEKLKKLEVMQLRIKKQIRTSRDRGSLVQLR